MKCNILHQVKLNIFTSYKMKSELVFTLIKETSLSLPRFWKNMDPKEILLSQTCPFQQAEGNSSPCPEISATRDSTSHSTLGSHHRHFGWMIF